MLCVGKPNVIRIVRWIIAIPVGIVAAVGMHFLMTLGFSLGHGFETAASFWEASDMNGMPISGTYILFVTRATTAAAFVGVTAYIVPAFHKYVGIVFATVVALGSLVLLAYLARVAYNAGLSLGVGAWYRNILEFVSYGLGGIVGAAIGSGAGERRTNA